MNPSPLSGPAAPALSGKASSLLVLLHGYGSNGQDMFGLVPMLSRLLPNTAFIAPNAPFGCELGGGGYQWFSLASRNDGPMRAGADAVTPILNDFLDAELRKFGLADSALALAGFSQGTMMALHVALRRPQAMAALVGYSGALLSADAAPAQVVSRPPMCLIHGTADGMVPFGALGQAEQALKAANVSVEAHARPGLAHSIDPQGLDIAVKFLQKHLP